MAGHRFKDEWALRALKTLPGVDDALIESLRKAGAPEACAALAAAGKADEAAVAAVVERVYGVPPLTPAAADVDRQALALVPEKACRARLMLPVRERDEELHLAMANPLDDQALQDAQALSGRSPRVFFCPAARLEALFDQVFAGEAAVFDALERLEDALPVEVYAEEGDTLQRGDELEARAPVIRLANALITKAVKLRASDIHIEHGETASLVRMRVDGELQNVLTVPRAVAVGPLVTRFKVMSNLDISDRLRPQDGRAKLRVGRLEVGLRVSTLPTQHGEKVVARLLDTRMAEVGLEALGFDPAVVKRLDALCEKGQGLILVTGPTGSGKTTTLYALLNRLKGEGTNVVTVEDPIEYRIKGLNQVQVNEKAGLGFAQVLRSVLRQDPDVILLGEIRDRETADVALQAALTGHLVLSTLHTNDAVSAVSRLEDMGVERFKLAPALLAVTAQRLVRRLCPACAKPAGAPPAELARALSARGGSAGLREAAGCAECLRTGYRGRQPILEFYEATPAAREAVGRGDSVAELRRRAAAEGSYFSLGDDALRLAAAGVTTLAEAAPYLGAPQDAPAAAAPAPPAAEGPAAVLVVDDDPTVRLVARAVLSKEGWAVREASDGAAALAELATSRPSLVVTDLQMPGIDGLGVIRGIRETLGDLRLPVLVLAASAEDEAQVAAFKAGADDYVVKPLKPAVLVARVRAALRRSAS